MWTISINIDDENTIDSVRDYKTSSCNSLFTRRKQGMTFTQCHNELHQRSEKTVQYIRIVRRLCARIYVGWRFALKFGGNVFVWATDRIVGKYDWGKILMSDMSSGHEKGQTIITQTGKTLIIKIHKHTHTYIHTTTTCVLVWAINCTRARCLKEQPSFLNYPTTKRSRTPRRFARTNSLGSF